MIKKILKILISITFLEEIVTFIVFILMIGGSSYIIKKTAGNLFIAIPILIALIALVTFILCKGSTIYHRFFNDEKNNDQEN